MSITIGVVSDAVQHVQNALLRNGISAGPANGRFSDQTAQAVRTFQGERRLAVTGVVDQATWHALGLPGPVPDGRAHAVD